MLQLKKIILIVAIIIAVPTAVIGYLVYSTLPVRDGQLTLNNLSAPVKIYRDYHGIPHIYADNQLDAYRALGWTMASERLFQLDIFRRLGSGTLSELVGERGLPMDKMFRTLRFRHHFEEMLEKNPENPDVQKILAAYIDGINQYIENSIPPLEYWLLKSRPKPFETLDAYGILGYMAFRFGIGFKKDFLLTKLSKQLAPEMLEQLRTEPGKFSDQVYVQLDNWRWNLVDSVMDELENHLTAIEGSNGWVLGPTRTSTGGAILANDPHVSFSVPGLWFEAHIDTPKYKVYGHFLPLIPFPITGHNQRIAWGVTMSYIDDMDFYREKVMPENGSYYYKGEWRMPYIYAEDIAVKGRKDEVRLPVKLTAHGPLLDEVIDEKNISLKWTYHLPENRPMEGLYRTAYATDSYNFKKALTYGTSPGINVLYADVDGNIGWWMAGTIPVRPNHVKSDFILDGGTGNDEYDVYVALEDRPGLYNPESGIIVSANYRPPGSGTEVQGYWQGSDRYESIHQILKQKRKWSIDELKIVQTANINVIYRPMLNRLMSYIDESALEAGSAAAKAYELVKNWNLKSEIDDIAPTIFHSWNRANLMLILDEIDKVEDRLGYCHLSASWHFYKRILERPDDRWWNILVTEKIEKAPDIVRLGLEKAVADLAQEFGRDMTNWKWGNVHQVSFSHPLGKVKPLDSLFNLGPYPAPGGWNQINNYRHVGCEDGFKVKAGPSARRLIDMSSPESSWGGLPLGTSGHLFDSYRDNQRKDFLAGQYRSQIMDKNLLLKIHRGQLILSPQNK